MISIIALFGFIIVPVFNQELPEVVTHQGLLKGTTQTSFRGKEFLAFLGIPYAKPPIGKLRFKVKSH